MPHDSLDQISTEFLRVWQEGNALVRQLRDLLDSADDTVRMTARRRALAGGDPALFRTVILGACVEGDPKDVQSLRQLLLLENEDGRSLSARYYLSALRQITGETRDTQLLEAEIADSPGEEIEILRRLQERHPHDESIVARLAWLERNHPPRAEG